MIKFRLKNILDENFFLKIFILQKLYLFKIIFFSKIFVIRLWVHIFWILCITIVPKNWKFLFYGISRIYEIFLYLPCLTSYQISKNINLITLLSFPSDSEYQHQEQDQHQCLPIAISQHFIFELKTEFSYRIENKYNLKHYWSKQFLELHT